MDPVLLKLGGSTERESAKRRLSEVSRLAIYNPRLKKLLIQVKVKINKFLNILYGAKIPKYSKFEFLALIFYIGGAYV